MLFTLVVPRLYNNELQILQVNLYFFNLNYFTMNYYILMITIKNKEIKIFFKKYFVQ